MLNFESAGPDAQGDFQVIYQTPGCRIPTVACRGMRTLAAANGEAKRRNDEQLAREKALRDDAAARGLYSVHPDLDLGATEG